MVIHELFEDQPLTPDAFKSVEAFLYRVPRYRATLDLYEQRRGDVLERGRQWASREGDRPTGYVADNTADKVLQLDDLERRADEARAAVSLVESVWTILSDEERQLVELKYWSRFPMTNEQVWVTMDLDFGISRGQWYRLRRKVISEFAFVMGLI